METASTPFQPDNVILPATLVALASVVGLSNIGLIGTIPIRLRSYPANYLASQET